jgi:hypothetical protein
MVGSLLNGLKFRASRCRAAAGDNVGVFIGKSGYPQNCSSGKSRRKEFFDRQCSRFQK